MTLNSGTGITAPGAMTLGGTYTVSINTSLVPQLTAANTFTMNQTFNANSQVIGDTRVDFNGLNAGSTSPGIRFGRGNTGEGISSDRTGAVNQGGIDLYAGFTPRLSVTNGGSVGIGTQAPAYTLDVRGTVSGVSSGAYGVYGQTSGTATGSAGVYGANTNTIGNNTPSYGVYGSGGIGVAGVSTLFLGTGNAGGSFAGFSGPSGSGEGGTDGIDSTGGSGDFSFATDEGGTGILAVGGSGSSGGAPGGTFYGGFQGANPFGDGVFVVAGNGYAGDFHGDLNVSGAIFAGTKDLKIDYPLDPANKYLVHASVESSEMMNIYTGNITTDSQGYATVQLPEWFEVLNTDFRYQLTVIGQFAQAIVGREIENNRFEIRTSAPNVKVSWQVTGVRQDAYAKANPLVVEQEKEARLRGFYIHPELYGAPAEKQIKWARHPQMMKRIQEMRAKQLAAAQKQGVPLAPPRN